MAKPKQYSERIQVVVTPNEGKLIKQLADKANLSLSGFCKQLILAAINLPEDTTQLLPIDTTQATTLDTTYVTTLDAANEYSKLWEAFNTLTKDNLAIREEVEYLVTTLATTQASTTSNIDLEPVTEESSTQLLSTILPIATTEVINLDTTQDTNLVTTALDPSNILTTGQLLDRLREKILAQSTAKTEKGRLAVLNNYLQTLSTTRLNRLAAITAKVDPDKSSWLPEDTTRQRWVMQPVAEVVT
ncbi:hypothetical protein [uncultured Nostoc sp.]|uniref:hypothetical protein n=1 Tax=uncultured Nostoc sp. TaxID=340711 RepID=UPI0026303ACF|nr:hypothetical protein [uncultured Nostoc sp.]